VFYVVGLVVRVLVLVSVCSRFRMLVCLLIVVMMVLMVCGLLGLWWVVSLIRVRCLRTSCLIILMLCGLKLNCLVVRCVSGVFVVLWLRELGSLLMLCSSVVMRSRLGCFMLCRNVFVLMMVCIRWWLIVCWWMVLCCGCECMFF